MIVSLFQNERDNQPKSAEASWEQVVESLRTPALAPCTPSTCEGKKCPHKMGRAWSPAVFTPGSTRAAKNVELVSALVLDMDHLTDAQLQDAVQRLSQYECVIHSTHNDGNSTATGNEPGRDRCVRAVVRLSEPVRGADWPAFWDAAVATLGVPADKATRDAGRLYFLPTRPTGTNYAFAASTSAKALVPSELGQKPVTSSEVKGIETPKDYPPATKEIIERARARLLEHGPSIKGQGGDKHALMVGMILLNDYALTWDEAWPLAVWWNANFPQNNWSLEKLAVKIRNGGNYKSGPRGYARDGVDAFDWLTMPARTDAMVEPMLIDRAIDLVGEIVEQSKIPPVMTKFPSLNKKLGGGFFPSTITLLIGPTGGGKTSLGTQLAGDRAEVGPVVYYAAEMTRAMIVAKVIAQRTGRSWLDVLKGGVKEDQMRSVLSELHLFMIGPQANPVEVITAAVDAVQRQYPNDVVSLMVDYVQLLADIGRDMRLSTMQAVRAIQSLTERKGLVTLMLSQSSRGNSEKIREGSGQAADYAETGAETAELERSATNVLVISFQAKDDAVDHEVTLFIAKGRFGGGSKVGFNFNGPTGVWSELGSIPMSDLEKRVREQVLEHVMSHARGECGVCPPLTTSALQQGTRNNDNHKIGQKATVEKVVRRMLREKELREVHAGGKKELRPWTEPEKKEVVQVDPAVAGFAKLSNPG